MEDYAYILYTLSYKWENVYMFRGVIHRTAETLALVIISQPPAAYSDCLNNKIPEKPNLFCGSAKALGGHTWMNLRSLKFNSSYMVYSTYKYTLMHAQPGIYSPKWLHSNCEYFPSNGNICRIPETQNHIHDVLEKSYSAHVLQNSEKSCIPKWCLQKVRKCILTL